MSVPRSRALFGSLLRERRLAAGLTQEGLAERSGVSPRTIQEVEAGSVHPRRSTAMHLVEALGLSDLARDELMRAAEPRPRPRRRDSGPLPGVPERHDVPDILLMPAPPTDDVVRAPTLVALPRLPQTNIPWPVSSLLGREAELAAIRDLIIEDRQRLVTLTGVGGSGKTRLATQTGADLLSAFADGVWFVNLAPTSNPALVPRSVAGALGVREVQDASIDDALMGFLRRRHLLLVLDNCEHLIDACAALAERLLTTCPDLTILATSREPLQIAGEQRRQTRPLDVPAPRGAVSSEALAGISSVRLFVERARAIDPDFTLTALNAAAVAEVCAQLDGIPLAIELAAARISVLSVGQIAERLDNSFRLLAGGTRAGQPRQQTMEAALGWSYDLLTGSEQAMFRALSTFASGFTLEAVEQVCCAADGDAPDTLDVLSRLVDKSLVIVERTQQGRRYRLLEPVRQYAHRLLVTGDEDDAARRRHASYYAALAERAAPMLRGPEQTPWLEQVEVERDNLRAALGWIAEHGAADDGLRLAVALTPYWEARGYLSEGRRWLEMALTVAPAGGASRATQLRALIAAGALAQWQGDLAGADTLLTEALTTARDLADLHSEAETLSWLSSVHRQLDAPERGQTLAEESLRLGHELGDEALIAFALLNLGVVLCNVNDVARAAAFLDECVLRYRRLGNARYAAIASTMLGWAALKAGDHDHAARVLHESVLALRLVGDQGFIVHGLRGLAHVSNLQGEPRRAAQVFATLEALRTALGMRTSRLNGENDRSLRADLLQQLTVSGFEEAYAEGEAMTLDEVLAAIAWVQ